MFHIQEFENQSIAAKAGKREAVSESWQTRIPLHADEASNVLIASFRMLSHWTAKARLTSCEKSDGLFACTPETVDRQQRQELISIINRQR